MLVLGRRRGEEVVLTLPTGEQIVLRVLEVRGQDVRLGFDAPSSVRVHRRELYDEIQRKAGSEPRKGA